MLDKIRIGIIGMGRMGITHYSIINSRSDVEIVAVADTSQLVLTLLKKYINGIKAFTNYQELINSGEVDAILVCTPPNLNEDILNLALKNNIHAFVEKPYTTNSQIGRQLANEYKSAGLVNQVGYVNRFNDVFTKAKFFIENGLLKDIYRFRSEMFSCTISQPDDGSGWRASRESGGGALFEMAAHAIDLVNYIVGKPVSVSGSSLNKVYSKNVEDVVSSTFSYQEGVTGTLYVNWSDHSFRKPTNKIEVTGKNGKLLADQHSLKIYLTEPNPQWKLRTGWNTLNITDIFESVPFYVRGNEFTRQLYHFVDSVKQRNLEQNLCDFSDGSDTLDIIDMIFKDAEGTH